VVQLRLPYSIICAALVVAVGCGSDTSDSSLSTSPSTRSAAGQTVTPAADAPAATENHKQTASSTSTAAVPQQLESPVLAADAEPQDPAAAVDQNRQPARVLRPDDTRSRHDDRRLARGGVRRFEVPHLLLYTDAAAESVQGALSGFESLYRAWVKYFGELPPNRAGTDFQITGYLISDRQRFERLGLIPVDLPPFQTGRHLGAEFWMLNPTEDYYRRHLLFHEATHCFMTFLEPASDPRPGWYLEGMAELFATHRQTADGDFEFRVMPHNKTDFEGLGRITALQAEVARGAALTLAQATDLPFSEYLSIRGYAWSWAVCCFLDAHPDYHERFRSLGRQTTGNSFRRLLAAAFHADMPGI